MKRGADSSALMAGFTIVETMIVLAVTGMLFVAIATTWFGRQHKTEFQTASQDIRNRIQQVISDVQNGYFPNQDNFTCTVNPSGLLLNPGSTKQGQNQQCVFLGKVIQFHFDNTSPEQFRVYTVAADSTKTDISVAKPRVIAPSTTPAPATGNGFPDNSVSGTLNSGLSLQAYKIGNLGVSHVTDPADIAIGFLSSLGSLDANGAYTNGTQQVNLYSLPEPGNVPSSSSTAANIINKILQSSPATYTSNTQTKLCFQSGGTKQYAVITLGGNSSSLTPDLTIKQGTCNVDFN